MKLVKSLLLGSVAGMAAVAGAQAADLPFRKAAPVEYVRVCDWTGAGYFYIPGTDTCIKIGGFIRAEYAYIQQTRLFSPTPNAFGTGGGVFIPGKNRDGTGFFARGRLEVDARTQTAYGTLRTFVRYQITDTRGNYAGGIPTLANNGGQNSSLDKGFIQFAGITAGKVQSFFDFYADNYNFEGIANSDQNNLVFAYTATFGGGFSATVSAEDRNVRNDGVGSLNALLLAPVGYAGETIPDIVANVRVDQAWGAAQLSGAYHDVNTISTGFFGPGTFASKTASGFAVTAGVQIKLPMLAAGDDLWIEGGYQSGAYLYGDSAGNLNSGFNNLAVGGFQHQDHDAVATLNAAATGYDLHLSRGFHVMAALHHYFTPQFHDVLFGSYEQVGYGNVVRNTDWRLGGIGDASEYRIGNQFIFTPVHNLDIGFEVFYAHIDQKIAGGPPAAAAFHAVAPGVATNPSAFEGRLRLERDF